MSADTDIELDLEQIRGFLRRHPEAVRADAELLALLAGDKHSDGVVDLAAAAREKLLSELRQQKALNESLVETARANLAVQSQTHMAVLALLECDSLMALDKKLAGRIATTFGVDALRVYIEGHAPLKTSQAIFGAGEGLVDGVLGKAAERLGPVEARFADVLYGPQAVRVKSEALVRLEIGERMGLFALGARDASAFTPGQGTELLSYLARALERLLHRWLV